MVFTAKAEKTRDGGALDTGLTRGAKRGGSSAALQKTRMDQSQKSAGRRTERQNANSVRSGTY